MIDFGVTYYRTAWGPVPPSPTLEIALQTARRAGRTWVNPWSRKLSQSFQYIRHLPRGLRLPLELTRELLPWAHLLVEGSERELVEELASAGVEQAVLLPNRTIDGQALPERCLAASRELSDETRVLYCRATELTGETIESAEARGIPLWIPAPRNSSIVPLRKALADHPRARFVLEGMNFDNPQVAFDLGREHENLFFTTARQPLEVISEGVRHIGSERLLFASGWPYLGDPIDHAAREVRLGVDEGHFAVDVVDRILHRNAAALLGERREEKPA